MQQSLEVKKEQKLKQVLKFNQKMQGSVKILSLSIEKLNEFIEEEVIEIKEGKAVEVKFFSNQKKLYRDDNYLQIEEFSQEKNFYEELEEQINFMKLDKKISETCIFIINNLNAKGYLELTKVEILKILNISKSELEEAFQTIYKLEPYGLGAYSLEVQLRQKNIQDKKLEVLLEKECIENYIENENKEKPYSDQELADMLNKDGFDIARRTVSKYRKELGYKSSSQRKI